MKTNPLNSNGFSFARGFARAALSITLLALGTGPLQAATLIQWGSTTTPGDPDIVTAAGTVQNISSTLTGNFINPNQGDYYNGSAAPTGKNPLMYGAFTANASTISLVNGSPLTGAPTADYFALSVANGTANQALWFWGQSMVYNASTPNTPTGFNDGADYGFQNGLNTGNVTLTSLSVFAGIAQQSSTSRDTRFVIEQSGIYYIMSASLGNVGNAGTLHTRDASSSTTLADTLWLQFDPTISLAAPSGTASTLANLDNIQGVGVWESYSATANARNFYLGGFEALGTVAAVPEPSTFAMLVGGLGLLVGFKCQRRR